MRTRKLQGKNFPEIYIRERQSLKKSYWIQSINKKNTELGKVVKIEILLRNRKGRGLTIINHDIEKRIVRSYKFHSMCMLHIKSYFCHYTTNISISFYILIVIIKNLRCGRRQNIKFSNRSKSGFILKEKPKIRFLGFRNTKATSFFCQPLLPRRKQSTNRSEWCFSQICHK